MQCYIPKTGIVRITDTLQYIPKSFASPKTTTEDYLQQDVSNILAIIQEPPNALPFISYVYATNNVINQIARILHSSTTQPRLTILPLPPMLPTVLIPTPLSTPITRPDTPAPRVVPVM